MCFDLYGCVQADVRPIGTKEDGKLKEGYWFDTHRLKILSKTPVMEQPTFELTEQKKKDPKGPSEKSTLYA